MPYTSPISKSPASSTHHSPCSSRRPSASSPKTELPRSTSSLSQQQYHHHHNRTNSLKYALNPSYNNQRHYASLSPQHSGTYPHKMNKNNDSISAAATPQSSSLRQSPPPRTLNQRIPAGAIMSPPESISNSSDEEEEVEQAEGTISPHTKKQHSRNGELGNVKDLQAAIRDIEKNRAGTMTQTSEGINFRIDPSFMSPTDGKEQIISMREGSLTKKAPGNLVIQSPNLLPKKPCFSNESLGVAIISDEEEDEDEGSMSGEGENLNLTIMKPSMVRKKSGELVRPALRPSTARRRPLSMPGTPTFSKAVHFDSHLEHIRHFLQVDRPLAVSAGSSPAPAYDSDGEFPFNIDSPTEPPASPYEWEIVVSNFPPETPLRLAQAVRVERVFLSYDKKTLVGSVAVANLAFNKYVVVRFTLDYWKTTSDVVAEFNEDLRQPIQNGYDRFNFNIKLTDQANLESKTMFFCVKYCVNGREYWDNNNSTNFQVDFRKKYIKGNSDRNQGILARSTGKSSSVVLPRSNYRSPTIRPKSMPLIFDDYADGFDGSYQFGEWKHAFDDYFGESAGNSGSSFNASAQSTQGDETLLSTPTGNTSFTRRGACTDNEAAVSNNARNLGQVTGNAFGTRYDFGASLSAAINASNSATIRERSNTSVKSLIHPHDHNDENFSLWNTDDPPTRGDDSVISSSMDVCRSVNELSSSQQTTISKPGLSSESYNDLLNKYCFFGSRKNSSSNKDSYLKTPVAIDHAESENNNSVPKEAITLAPPFKIDDYSRPNSKSSNNTKTNRSPSPVVSKGYSSSMFSTYQNLHDGHPFFESHSATAIRGQ